MRCGRSLLLQENLAPFRTTDDPEKLAPLDLPCREMRLWDIAFRQKRWREISPRLNAEKAQMIKAIYCEIIRFYLEDPPPALDCRCAVYINHRIC